MNPGPPLIHLNRMLFPVTTLGPGRRIGLWFQGCSLHCLGCISRDLWAFSGGSALQPEEIAQALAPWWSESDGVTISGGEPFEQPEALDALLDLLHEKSCPDIFVYSGFSAQKLFSQFPRFLPKIDVLISEPYIEASSNQLLWRGSDNQVIHLTSERARTKYPEDISNLRWSSEKRLDVFYTEKDLVMAGIPKRGDLDRLQNLLASKGVSCTTSSQPSP